MPFVSRQSWIMRFPFPSSAGVKKASIIGGLLVIKRIKVTSGTRAKNDIFFYSFSFFIFFFKIKLERKEEFFFWISV